MDCSSSIKKRAESRAGTTPSSGFNKCAPSLGGNLRRALGDPDPGVVSVAQLQVKFDSGFGAGTFAVPGRQGGVESISSEADTHLVVL